MSKQPTYDYQGYELNTEENASFEEKRLTQLSRLLAALEKRKSRIEVMIQFMDPHKSFGEVLDEFNLIDARITNHWDSVSSDGYCWGGCYGLKRSINLEVGGYIRV